MSDRDQAGEVLPGDAEATTQENDDPPFVPAAQVDILKEHLQRHERSLAARMARVLSKVQRIAKDATAPHAMGGFKYVKEPDVYDAVRPLLAEEGIATTFNVEDWEVFQAGQKGDGKPVWAMKGLARLTFHANGETMESTLPMFAIDYGDKAGQKLASNAEKYLVLKTFLIATGEDDAEQHDVESGFQAASSLPSAEQRRTIRDILSEAKKHGIKLGDDLVPPESRDDAEALIKRIRGKFQEGMTKKNAKANGKGGEKPAAKN